MRIFKTVSKMSVCLYSQPAGLPWYAVTSSSICDLAGKRGILSINFLSNSWLTCFWVMWVSSRWILASCFILLVNANELKSVIYLFFFQLCLLGVLENTCQIWQIIYFKIIITIKQSKRFTWTFLSKTYFCIWKPCPWKSQ